MIGGIDMQTRSSKYLDENISTKPKLSRANKNKYLYDEVNKNIGYEEIENFSNYEDLELDSSSSIKTREEYQQSRVYKDFDINNTNENVQAFEEEKKYDINSVLEEAKKNRVIPDDIEKKRKLQNAEYNILADLNKKYMSKKEKIEEELEKEGIRELIDTITSKSLVKDLEDALDEEDDDGDLMSDLMATNTLTAVQGISLEEEIAKEILANEKEEDDEIANDHGNLVNSFYTKSMDLSEHDFEFKEEIEEENKEKRKILILVVLIVIVIFAIISLVILRKFGII